MLATEPINDEILKSATGGDRDAFASVVREHQSMVFSMARQFLRDPSLAEELAQEVFFDLYEHLGEMQSSQHVLWWLRKVTSRRCIDYVRRVSNRPSVRLEAIAEPAAPSVRQDPFMPKLIDGMLASLPERQRVMVILRYQEEMEPTEIAKVLSVPVNSVKSCLHRTLALLRQKMENVGVRR